MGMELPITSGEGTEMEDEVGYSDWELALHVREALKSARNKDDEKRNNDYQCLLTVMSMTNPHIPEQVGRLVASLKALSRAASDIDIEEHKQLLTSIFEISMWSYGPIVIDALVELTIHLAASGSGFVVFCLELLIKNFVPPEYFLRQPRGVDRKKQVQVHTAVHSALIGITRLMSVAASLSLEKLIVMRMPSLFKGDLTLIYVESMLMLERSELGETLGPEMLEAVMKRLLELDVEIGWDHILQLTKRKRDEILQDEYSKGIFDMELEVIEENDDVAGNNDTELQSLGSDTYFDKLDSLMVLACEHLKSCYKEERLVMVFETLLGAFEKMTLTAYKSKFSQFLIFYACSLDPECAVRFAVKLIEIFENDPHPLVRMSAVAYLASYLSRGKFLLPSFIVEALERLVGWCFKYCKRHDGEETVSHPGAHGDFYSASQAIMYVLCFRMGEMMDISHLKSKLKTILRHPLGPLKVCLPTIVREFLQQAKSAQLFSGSEESFFSNLLESDLSKAFGGKERLDMFFPFDPCLLKNCDSYIRPYYNYWSEVKKPYYEDVKNDEDGFAEDREDVENDEDDFAEDRVEHLLPDDMGRSYDEDALDLDYSMNKMSITPKSSFKYNRYASDLQMSMQMPPRIRPSTSPESL